MFRKTRPTITSHRATSLPQANAGEILDSQSDSRCRRWRPAKLRGHSVSSALPCISFRIRAKGAAGTFQRGMSPNHLRPETGFSKAQPLVVGHNHTKTSSTQQAWMNSRNQTTIASRSKHRQPLILHPTMTGLERQPVGFAATVQKPGILRKERSGSRQEAPARKGRALAPPERLDLLIPLPASTLQVFQFIGQFVCIQSGQNCARG